MNSENSKTSDPHRILLKLADKIDLRRKDKYIVYQILAIIIHGKILKSHIRMINLKYQLRHGMNNLNYLMDNILYVIFKIILNIYYKSMEKKPVNPSIKIYINKKENRTTFTTKTGYYLEILTPETTKLLGSTKIKIKKNENGENVPRLEIAEIVLIHCNVVKNIYRVLYTFVRNKSFGQLLNISPENVMFLKTFSSEFSHIDVWFTDQPSKPLEIEDKINITLVIN